MGVLGRFPLIAIAAIVAAILSVGGSAQAEKRLGFVVGIKDYPNLATKTNPANGQLRTSLNDADTMAATPNSLGFDVTVAKNVGYAAFFTTFEAFKRKIEPGDTVFFFYAGHGVGLRGANYLLPSDVPPIDPDSEQLLRRQSIAEADVITDIQDRGAKVTIVVLDSCRDNPIEEFAKKQAQLAGRPFKRGVGMTSRGLAAGPAVSGVFSIYSAGLGEEALDGLGRGDPSSNSVFTRVFAERLKQSGLSLVDLFYDVQDEVATLAQKVADDDGKPHKQTPAIYSETRGGRTIYLAGLPQGAAADAAQGSSLKPPAAVTPPQQEARLSDPSDPLRLDLVTDCDRLAASPLDPQRPRSIAGVIASRIDIVSALSACNAATSEYPDIARFAFQAGRVAGQQKDYAVARQLYEKAASMGSSAAMNNIGAAYLLGQGVAQDYSEARKWYEKAGSNGLFFHTVF